MSAIAYFRRKKPIKRLPRDLVTPLDFATVTDDEALLMKASAAKDRPGAKKVMGHYRKTSALEVIPLLPVQKVMSFRQRLVHWFRRLEGSSEHDPLIQELRRLRRRTSYTIRHGYLETPMD